MLVASLTLWASSVSAHDFWLEPSTFRPKVGENLTVSLLVGQNFVGDPIPRSSQLIDSFVVREQAGTRPVNGFENQDPAGLLRVEKAGLAIVAYRSKPYLLDLPADKFEEFLKNEGLQQISAMRMKRGESAKPDRERFFRYAKAFVVAGKGGGDFARSFGFRYELIPETDPMGATPLRVRAVFEGKPLAGIVVSALHRDDPKARLTARTDASGRVTFALPKPGVWLVKSVQMVAAPKGADVDWESLWASLTFQR